MHVVFPSQEIPVVKVKNKGTIKAAVDKYRSRQTPMKQLLTDYLAVKSYGDRLAEAENPWAYYYKGIEGHEIEMGVSYHETLFNLSAMSLKKELPKSIEEYTKEDYEKAIDLIRERGYERNGINRQYSESSIHHFQNLIYYVVFQSSVCECY